MGEMSVNEDNFRGTVLLVDDEAMVRKSTEKWLTMAGFEVIGCDSGAEALKHISESFRGIVVSDVKMPEMSGLEFMALALTEVPGLPVVLVTAAWGCRYGDLRHAERGL